MEWLGLSFMSSAWLIPVGILCLERCTKPSNGTFWCTEVSDLYLILHKDLQPLLQHWVITLAVILISNFRFYALFPM